MDVTYKDIAGFDGYRVGSDGTVWTRRNNRWGLGDVWRQLKPGRVGCASAHYARQLVMLGRGNPRYVHTLVLEAFAGPRPGGYEARHLDGDTRNNSISNLVWGTRVENMRDMSNHGRKKGARHHRAMLTDDQVRNIRQRASAGESHTSIASSLGLQRRNVSRIIDRSRWPHVE